MCVHTYDIPVVAVVDPEMMSSIDVYKRQALPGEDGDYTVRIGTDSFETTGVIMAMMPGTVCLLYTSRCV